MKPCRISPPFALVRLLFFSVAVFSVQVFAAQVPGPLVDTEWLKTNLDKVVVLDVRTSPVSFENKAPTSKAAVNPCGVSKKQQADERVAGHIPGAALVLWNNVHAESKVGGEKLKGMLLPRAAFDRLMKNNGVSNDSTVVITHNGESMVDALIATRLYWTMKYYGHDDMALLDGGTKNWILSGGAIEYGKPRPGRGKYRSTAERKELLATADDVAAAIDDPETQVLDSRATEDYLGLTYHPKLTSQDRKGHVPSAKSWPVGTQVNTKGVASFYGAEDIQGVARILGVDLDKPSITYCWSGGLASLSWFVLHEILGNENARLYDGSMHEWTKDAGRPLASMVRE